VDIVITRAEFEQCISAVTDLVQATVRHTLQRYLASLPRSGTDSPPSQFNRAEETDGAVPTEEAGEKEAPLRLSEEGEEEDGFVTITKEALAASPAPTSAVEDQISSQTGSQSAVQGTESLAEGAIQEVVLVGGSSRVPAVRAAIRRALGEAGVHHFGPAGERDSILGVSL
jgi:hypothetical protein